MSTLRKIYDKANGKLAIVSVVLFGLFMAIVLPYFAGLTEQYGSGPDTMFDFSLGSYYDFRLRYGVEGRRLYIILRWTFDIVWPTVYTFFYFMCIGYLGKKTKDIIGYKWLLVPVVAVVLDLLENTFATIFLATFPKEVDLIVYLLMMSSMFKWLFVSLSLFVILYLFVRRLVQLIVKNRK
jgi:hypothetical protein